MCVFVSGSFSACKVSVCLQFIIFCYEYDVAGHHRTCDIAVAVPFTIVGARFRRHRADLWQPNERVGCFRGVCFHHFKFDSLHFVQIFWMLTFWRAQKPNFVKFLNENDFLLFFQLLSGFLGCCFFSFSLFHILVSIVIAMLDLVLRLMSNQHHNFMDHTVRLHVKNRAYCMWWFKRERKGLHDKIKIIKRNAQRRMNLKREKRIFIFHMENQNLLNLDRFSEDSEDKCTKKWATIHGTLHFLLYRLWFNNARHTYTRTHATYKQKSDDKVEKKP